MIGNYSYANDATSEFKNKNIEDWIGEDCLKWASEAEKELNIPLSSWVSIDGFYRVTAESNKMYDQNLSLDFNENTTWTVPQIDIPDFEMSLSEHGNQFGSSSLSYLHYEDSVASPSSHLSPSYGSSLSYSDSCSYDSLSPSYGSLSPSFSGAQSSFGGLSPLPSESGDQFSCSSNPTYITQPSILSGGSLSYGACGGAVGEDIDRRLPSSSPNCGYSSLLPDFNSLMIGDGNYDNASSSLDLNELDVSFNEETFSDLDHYIHSDDFNANTDFDKLNEAQRAYAKKEMESSLLPSVDQGSLEDCMLKKITTGKRGNRVRHPQSWEFLVRLLMNPKTNPSLIKWEDKKNGIFRLVQKEEIAKLWGKRKELGRKGKKGINVTGLRAVFQFCMTQIENNRERKETCYNELKTNLKQQLQEDPYCQTIPNRYPRLDK
ncbi:DNA-binding protein D-ETS-4 [Armadillidium nasatum]|uniref:DNA-binding protein D-ETS-4 n=1 Tax=Armadillidium nasatum TaxID=96803 RepID=A0A5N5SWP3_9CRUS|nr:DNA-binding protein D-ETS-4 [Armadillidium nasatum]